MIKDLVVNLSVEQPTDVARDYAISIAAAFGAHLAAIAASYEPFMPGQVVANGFADALAEKQRKANEQAALGAIERFDRVADMAVPSRESRLVSLSSVDI